MKKIFTNTITLLAEIAALIIGIIWFWNSRDYEPLIVIIPSFVSLITTWVLKNKELPNLEIKIIPNGKGSKPTQTSSLTPRNEEGIPIMQVGNMIGMKEISWKYVVKIINNSTITAFNPELYISNEFNDLNFIGNLSINSPIKGAESVDLEITYAKLTDGTPNEREIHHSPKFPPEIVKGLKMVIKYSSETGENVYKKFEFENGEEKNKKIKKIDNIFSKAKIYPRMF